jgi:hypothetical protein
MIMDPISVHNCNKFENKLNRDVGTYNVGYFLLAKKMDMPWPNPLKRGQNSRKTSK